MYLREHRYLKDVQVGNAGTFDQELPESGVLTGIRIQWSMVSASGIEAANRPRIIDRITSLEVNDGADKAAYSVRGQQAKAINFFDYGRVDYEKAELFGTKTQRTDVVIPFGRYIGDPYFGLNLAEYDELWLEHVNDLSTTQCATNALKSQVNLIFMEDLPSVPANYIKNYEWRAEKPAAAGQYVRQKLPTKALLRRVFTQLDPDLETAGNATSDPKSDSYVLKVTLKDGTDVLWDHRPRDIARLNAMMYGYVETQTRVVQSASVYFDLAIMDVMNAQAAEVGTAMTGTAIHSVMEASNDRFQKLANIASGTTKPEMLDVRAVGAGYYHCLNLYDAGKGEMSDYLDPSKTGAGKGTVEIESNGHSADHYIRTVLSIPVANGAF